MKLSIIIPVYNEEKTIEEVLRRVNSAVIPIEFEVIVVDDGSSDRTVTKIKNQISKVKNIQLVQHSENLGKGAAVKTGTEHAKGDYIIIQDADLEYNPADIPKLVENVGNGTQVVYGTRLRRLPHLQKEERTSRFLIHYFGNRLLSLLTSILYGQWITDMETCYKLFPKNALRKITLRARRFDFEPEITAKLLKCGFKIKEVPIVTKPRSYKEGKKLHTIKDGSIALWTLLKYRFVD